MMIECWDSIVDLESLRDCLDYVAWSNSQENLRNYVSKEISEINTYLKSGQGSHIDVSKLLNTLVELRKGFVKNGSSYGSYTSVTFREACYGGNVYNLNICLHRLYSALMFLWFNTSSEAAVKGGGGWSELSCNDANKQLCKWLTSPHASGSGLIAGGFSISNLNGTNGKQIASNIEKVLNSNGDLQKCLYGLLFSPPWMPEKTANACLLVKQLCEEISNDTPVEELRQDYSNDYDNIKQICKELMQSVGKITNGNGDKILSVVYKDSKSILQYNVKEHFGECFGCVRTHLPELIDALKHMKEQCIDWTAEKIKNARTPGPFVYGFTFTEKCNPSNSKSTTQPELTESIKEVVQSLNELNEILNPTSHSLAIGLGVVSTLLVGGSAAAAYFYPGLLSSTINMVVG